jgi:hypothetical protein
MIPTLKNNGLSIMETVDLDTRLGRFLFECSEFVALEFDTGGPGGFFMKIKEEVYR